MIRTPARNVLPAKSGVTLLGRIRGSNGSPITQATMSTITYVVTNLTTGASVTSGSFTISSTVFDDLQQGNPRWRADSASQPGEDGEHGYNFAASLGASSFAASSQSVAGVTSADVRYQADVIFTPVSGEAFRESWEWTARKVFG